MNDKMKSSQYMIDTSDLTSETWRIFQIMAEFVEGFRKLSNIQTSVGTFGSSRLKPSRPYYRPGEKTCACYQMPAPASSQAAGPA